MKKSITIKLLAFFMLIGGLSIVKPFYARAAYVAPVSNLVQINASKDSIMLQWTPSKNAVEYRIYYKEAFTNAEYTLSGAVTDSAYTVTGLKDGAKYSVQVKASDGEKESSASTIYDAVTLPDKLEGLKQKSWYYFIHNLNVEWEKKSGVSGYEVSLINSKGKTLQKKEVTSASMSYYKIKDSVYNVTVRAYTLFQNNKHYSSPSTINCIPQARISKLKIKGGRLSVSWNKVDGATGYKIYLSTKEKKGYKLVKTLGKKKGSCTLSKFKGKKFNSKKPYYIYVQTICNKGKKKGTSGILYYWSTVTNKWNHLTS